MAEVFSTALEDGLTSVKMMGFADISDDEIRRILSEHDCRVQDAIGAIISANESAREAKLQEDDIPAHRDPMPITSPAARPSVPSPAAEPCSTFADPEQAELVDSLTRMLLMPSDFNSLASSSSFPSPSSYPPREPCDAPANTPQTSDPTAVSHRTLSPLSPQAASFEPNPGQLSWGRPAPIVDQDGFTVLPQPALLQVVPSRAAAKGPRDRGALAAESARGDAALDPHMLVLVGVPGSGKSTLAKRLEERGWACVNQDTLGSRRRCEEECAAALAEGRRVVIDRTNIDEAQRAHWVRLARDARLPATQVAALVLRVPVHVCRERVMSRTGHKTLPPERSSLGIVDKFAGELRLPRESEGFARVVEVRDSSDSVVQRLLALDP